jgi:hypothetical protein
MHVVLDEVLGVWLVFLKMLDVAKKCFEELVRGRVCANLLVVQSEDLVLAADAVV